MEGWIYSMAIKPLPGYVLIEPIEDEGKSAGGVYLPESTQDKPSRGKVVAISKPYQNFSTNFQTAFVQSPVEVGDIVCYKKWTNQEVEYEGNKYLLVGFSELLGIIE